MLLIFPVYVVLAYAVLRLPPWMGRKLLFALLNVAMAMWICVQAGGLSWLESAGAALVYVGASLICLWLARWAARGTGPWRSLSAVGVPIMLLIGYKIGGWPFAVGASYAAFRASALALEIDAGRVPHPDALEYLAFLFFVPTFLLGPISPYRYHQASLANPDRAVTPVFRSFGRIVVGWAKYKYVAELFHPLTFQGLWYDGYGHGVVDFAVSAVCSYLYLYFNFSGFCDLAIGAAGLLGIKVKENFNSPLMAESIPDFWNRWHITLSEFMRDVFFTPFSRMLLHRFGPRSMHVTVPVAIIATFFLIGAWHGLAWNYVIFGLLHGGAASAHFVYSQFLQRRTTPEWRRRYAANRWVLYGSRAVTFGYVSCSFFFLENDTSYIVRGITALLARGGL